MKPKYKRVRISIRISEKFVEKLKIEAEKQDVLPGQLYHSILSNYANKLEASLHDDQCWEGTGVKKA